MASESNSSLNVISPIAIETRMFSEGFSEYVGTLASYRGAGDRSLSEIMGSRLPEVLQDGLRVLSQREVRQLLDNPSSLMALQDAVFEDGSDYWNRYLNKDEGSSQPNRWIDAATAATGSVDQPTLSPASQQRSWLSRHAAELLALSLMAAVAFFIVPNFLGPETGSATDRLAFVSPASMNGVTAENWSGHIASGMRSLKANPTNEREFAQQISECMEACTVIVNNDFNFLANTTNQELKNKCGNWMEQVTVIAKAAQPLSKRRVALNNLLDEIADKISDLDQVASFPRADTEVRYV